MEYLQHKEVMLSVGQEAPAEIKEAKFVPARLHALEAKLKAFSKKVKAGEVATIEVTVDEINLGIAKLEKMNEFKEKMFITKIVGQDDQAVATDGRFLGSIYADVAFPINSGFSERRYLNGTIEMLPSIEQGSLFPTITTIKPATGAPVPEKMVRFLPQALFSSYRTDPDLISVFHKLSTVELKDNLMVITSDPAYKPIETPDAQEGIDNLLLGLSIFGIIFFVFFSTGVMIYWIRKRNNAAKAND